MNINNILPEQVKDLLTEESLQTIQTAVEEKAKTLVEANKVIYIITLFRPFTQKIFCSCFYTLFRDIIIVEPDKTNKKYASIKRSIMNWLEAEWVISVCVYYLDQPKTVLTSAAFCSFQPYASSIAKTITEPEQQSTACSAIVV